MKTQISVSKFLALLAVIASSFLFIEASAQSSLRDSVIRMSTIELSLGLHAPIGDMSARFGGSAAMGAAYRYKTKDNWQFGLEGSFFFGNDVKEQVATGLLTSEGFIIDRVGGFTELLVLERGMLISATIGKVIPVFGPNPNSGFVFRFGSGFMQHKIRLETRNNDVPQLEGDYLKGYDRLSNGLMLHQFVGYQYLSNKRLINFTLGIEGFQGFTQSRRDFNFDLMKKDETKRLDSLYGLRFSWNFPIYRKSANGYYY
jgi:hypothetical protein